MKRVLASFSRYDEYRPYDKDFVFEFTNMQFANVRRYLKERGHKICKAGVYAFWVDENIEDYSGEPLRFEVCSQAAESVFSASHCDHTFSYYPEFHIAYYERVR
jgi:hypothetical protein